jgi:hypothetical protein
MSEHDTYIVYGIYILYWPIGKAYLSLFPRDIFRIPNSAVKNTIIPIELNTVACVIPSAEHRITHYLRHRHQMSIYIYHIDTDKSFYTHAYDISRMLFFLFPLYLFILFYFPSFAATHHVIPYNRTKKYIPLSPQYCSLNHSI